MFQKCQMFISLVLLFVLAKPSLAHDPWMEKFLRARRDAAGSSRNHSTEEAKRFLVLEGKPKTALVGKRRSEVVVEETPVAKPLARPKAKKSPRKKKTVPYPVDELLVKARQSYANGQLEKAKRFYSLVIKADPQSKEAGQRLAEINRELN